MPAALRRLVNGCEQLWTALGPSMGKLLAPIGAAFQDLFTKIINLANAFVKKLDEIFGISTEGAVKETESIHSTDSNGVERLEDLVNAGKGGNRLKQRLIEAQAQLNATRTSLQELQAEARKAAGFGTQVDLTKFETPTPGGSSTGTDQSAQQLKAAQDLLFASQNRLRLLKEMTPIEKLQEEAAVKKLEIERKYDDLLANQKSAEEVLALSAAERNELKAVELGLAQATADLQEQAVSGIKDEIALLEAKLSGKEEEYLLTKEIKDLEAQGVRVKKPPRWLIERSSFRIDLKS